MDIVRVIRMFIRSPRTMGVIPTIENLYQIIVIVPGTPGCRHQTPTVGACCLGNEREEDCQANGSVKRNLFLSLIDKYFAEKIHCKDLSLKYLAPNKALFSFPAPGSGNPVMTT